jgi:hypothetical protein
MFTECIHAKAVDDGPSLLEREREREREWEREGVRELVSGKISKI